MKPMNNMKKIVKLSKIVVSLSTDAIECIYLDMSDKNFRNRKKRLLQLKGKYSGKRCFIMGNGPSLNQMDLNLLKNEYVWGSNRCYLLFDRIDWQPSFYTAVDTRVVPDNADEINLLSDTLKHTHFFFPALFRKKKVLHSSDNVYWFEQFNIPDISSNHEVPFNKVFSTDVSNQVATVYTVTITALQFAVYLGFNPIYLIGCDTSYKIPPSVKFENNDPLLLVSTADDDDNHFDKNYFGKQHKWHDPQTHLMIKQYEYAKKSCDHEGIQVFNATIGGNLEVFPRVEYYSLFSDLIRDMIHY